MRIPDAKTGLWPAAWLLGENQPEYGWPGCGEIDMMEQGMDANFRAKFGYADKDENSVVGSNLICN